MARHAITPLPALRSLRPESCVEIGSAQGWSACHIGLALRENVRGKLYAIDPHHPTSWNDTDAVDTLPILRQNLRRCGIERYVEIVRSTSEEAARNWTAPIDFLFIDGDHSYAGVKSDFEMFAPLVRAGGVVAFHDIVPDWRAGRGEPTVRDSGGVPQFWSELRNRYSNNCREFIDDPQQDGCGIGIIRWAGQ